MKIKPTKWLCTDGKTWRAGDRKAGIWCNVAGEAAADTIIDRLRGMTVSEAYASFFGYPISVIDSALCDAQKIILKSSLH